MMPAVAHMVYRRRRSPLCSAVNLITAIAAPAEATLIAAVNAF